MKLKLFLTCCFIAILLSCQNKKETNQEKKSLSLNDFPKVNNNQNYVGVYQGILPCADCEGMETKITVNENNTYTKSVRYLGKGNKIFEQKGTISWNTLGNVLELLEIQNSPNKYLVTTGKLTQLDLEGKIIEGSLEKEYELTKLPAHAVEIENNQVTGPTVNLNNKLEATAKIEHVNPAVGKHTLAETKWKLIKLNGKTVKQKGSKTNFIKINSSDGKFSAYAGCNNIMGSYAMPKVNSISFSEIGATRMACPDMSIENEFMRMLKETTHYVLDKDNLTFFGTSKTPIATFVVVN